MKIDIREDSDTNVTQIYWTDSEYITCSGFTYIEFNDNCGSSYEFCKSDIDNLIKALQKARELWCE